MSNDMKKQVKETRKGITLVELVVAMALTALFAAACVMLILPVSKIYTRALDENRAQIVADSVVEALRTECLKAIITGTGDAWIANPDDYDGTVMTDVDLKPAGSVLVFRRNSKYCETIAANYVLGDTLSAAVFEKDMSEASFKDEDGDANGTVSRSIYSIDEADARSGLVHYGYYESNAVEISGDQYIYPFDYFDFTNPFTQATYMGYTVELRFHDLKYTSEDIPRPAYVTCDVTVLDTKGSVYTRSAVLCFQ